MRFTIELISDVLYTVYTIFAASICLFGFIAKIAYLVYFSQKGIGIKNKILFPLLLNSVSVKGGKSILFCSISDNLVVYIEIARK